MSTLAPNDKSNLGIPRKRIAVRLADSKAEALAAGHLKNDILIAFDGKRELPYRTPQYYPLVEHATGDMM